VSGAWAGRDQASLYAVLLSELEAVNGPPNAHRLHNMRQKCGSHPLVSLDAESNVFAPAANEFRIFSHATCGPGWVRESMNTASLWQPLNFCVPSSKTFSSLVCPDSCCLSLHSRFVTLVDGGWSAECRLEGGGGSCSQLESILHLTWVSHDIA
jgi:hypothetical protein